MDDISLAFTPAWKQRVMIATRQISPVELVELYLRRIDSLNPQLNAYLTVVGDMALGWAKDAEAAVMRRDRLAPLHGIPISIKDLNATKGIRTTNGSLIFKDNVPEAGRHGHGANPGVRGHHPGQDQHAGDGPQGSTENRLGPPCRNPWDTTRTPGGSSGGAAAGQVSGLSSLSQGSDGGRFRPHTRILLRPLRHQGNPRPRALHRHQPRRLGPARTERPPSPATSETRPSSSRPCPAPTTETPSAFAPSRPTSPPTCTRASRGCG